MRTNASGDANTAMGHGSLRSHLAGFDTAVGTNSLRDSSTGARNTATGPSALLRNTSGDTNAAHGNNALANNTSGSRNTAVGAVAGYYATTGNDLSRGPRRPPAGSAERWIAPPLAGLALL